MTQETFYDKPTIIAVMKVAMQRLRTKHVLVPTVVTALQARGIRITRGRFDDLFLQRPERDMSASYQLFENVIAVMFELHPQVLTTTEFVRLSIAVRIPFQRYATYMHYFPQDEWQQIMHGYGLEVTSALSSQVIVGRDRELSQWYEAVVSRRNIGVYGVAGVGKTAFAYELLHTVETYHGTTTYVINGRQIDSWHTCITLIQHEMRLLPVIPAMQQRQLARVIHREHPYLLITNIDEIQGIDARQLLAGLHTQFPTLRCIVTACEWRMPGYVDIVLTGLEAGHVRAPASQLFERTRVATTLPAVSSSEMMHMCIRVGGLPLALILAANLQPLIHDNWSVSAAIRQLSMRMVYAEYRILTLLLLFQMPISHRFIELFGAVACVTDVLQVRRALTSLGERRLITVRTGHDNNLYQVPAAVCAEFRIHMSADIAAIQHHDLLQAILRIDWRWEDTYHLHSSVITRYELRLVAEFVDVLLAHHNVVAAVQVLTQFHSLWRRMGMSADIQPALSRCMHGISVADNVELYYLQGCVALDCGDTLAAMRWMEQALTAVASQPVSLLRARIMLDMSMVLLQVYPQLSDTQLAQITDDLTWAHHVFGHHAMPAWQARVDNVRSFLCWSIGNMRGAMEYNDYAMRFFNVTGHSLGFLDTILQRGLVLTSIGDVRGARNYLTQAQRAYAQLDMPESMAFCRLRIASSYAYEGDTVRAHEVIRTMISSGECFVTYRIMLYALDILGAIMVLSPATNADGQLLFALTNRFRDELCNYRGAALDVVLTQRMRNAPVSSLPAQWVHADMTYADVVQYLAQ